ncbi:hypothetical protein AAVH_43256, partial [Aphelenchoides avenae]
NTSETRTKQRQPVDEPMFPPIMRASRSPRLRKQLKPAVQADNAGSKGTARKASSGSDASRTPSSGRRRPLKPSTSSTDQEPTLATPPAAKKTSEQGDSSTPPGDAALEQKYTIAEAIRLRSVPTTTWTDADFRKEIENFWENWRDSHAKKGRTMPDAWTELWKTHKCGKHLWARYEAYQSTFMARTVSSQHATIHTVTTTSADQPTTSSETTSTEQSTASTATTTTEQSTTSATPTTSTLGTRTEDPTAVSSTTDVDPTEPAEGEGVFGEMPPLSDIDLAILDGPLNEEQHAEDFLSDKFGALLYEADMEEDKPTAEPTPVPADNAGTEGGISTVRADNATTVAGTAGGAVE